MKKRRRLIGIMLRTIYKNKISKEPAENKQLYI
jgi:hypothetical protein